VSGSAAFFVGELACEPTLGDVDECGEVEGPDPHDAFGADGRERRAIGVEGEAADPCEVAPERELQLAGPGVPEADGAAGAVAMREPSAVNATPETSVWSQRNWATPPWVHPIVHSPG
jgi:hypothetical protein